MFTMLAVTAMVMAVFVLAALLMVNEWSALVAGLSG
jgi:hypothetical protein